MLYYISLSSLTHMLFAMESKDTCYTLYAVQYTISVDTCATYKCTHVLLQC